MSRIEKRDQPAAFSTIRQIAERYQTSERQVRRWIEAGDLVVHRYGRMVRIQRKDHDDFEKQRWCP